MMHLIQEGQRARLLLVLLAVAGRRREGDLVRECAILQHLIQDAERSLPLWPFSLALIGA